jgi:hypothetical protein
MCKGVKTVDLLQNKPDYVLKIKTQLHEYENLININATKKEKIQKSFEIMVLAKLFIQFMLVNKDIHYSFIETIYNKLIEIRNHISNVDIASHQLDENFILYYKNYLDNMLEHTKSLITFNIVKQNLNKNLNLLTRKKTK